MIEIRLFGDLYQRAADPALKAGGALFLPEKVATLGQVLARVGINGGEVGNVFLNGRLLPRSVYPITLGYPLAAEHPLSEESYLDTIVSGGDRLGIFPRKMSLVVV